MADPVPVKQPFLATATPDAADQRRSRAAIAVSVFSVVAAAPFASAPLPRIEAFIPSYEAALTIIDLLTAVLLLSQFTILRRWSLLVLAAAYLFNTLLIAAHALSFPGVFAQRGLFGDAQTTGWLYVFWHIGFPILITVYARAAGSPRDPLRLTVSTGRAAASAATIVAIVAALLVVLSAFGARALPVIVVDGDYSRLVTTGTSPAIILACLVAIAALWRQRARSVLDIWLFTVLWVWICDVSLSAVVSSARFHLGWYGGRLLGLFAASVLLIAFLFELDRLYARLGQAVRDAEARNAELIRSRGELVRAQRLEALGQLTGAIAHDFNNLLAAIGGNLEMIVRRPTDRERVERLAGNALKTSERGAQLIRRLMSIARKQDLRPEFIDTRQALDEFATLAAGIVRPVDRLRFETADSGTICVDASELQAALLNLVTNARDAMPDGGEIAIATRTLAAGTVGPHDESPTDTPRMQITVTDQGTGIAPELQARIFEPFFTTKSLGLGTGLGLSQVYGFAQGAGGHVFVDSRPGRGSTFSLVLPRASVPPTAKAAAKSDAKPSMSQGRVLLVEDDPDVLAATRDRVEDLGYSVVAATSGDEAMSLLTHGLAVDIVFSDIVMPGRLNGVQLATAARALRPGLKVLLTSGFTGGALDRLALPDHFVFLPKPYNQKDLGEKLVAAAKA